MTSYTLAPDIFRLFPGYCRGVVLARDFRNGPSTPELTALLREAEAGLRARVTGNPAEHPRIAAWREAYRRFGAKPSEHRSAVEALTRRVLKPDQLPAINALVDIGNLVSLRHLLPAGAHPTDALQSGLELRLAREGDRFAPPDGGPVEFPPAGEVVFTDGQQVLTRRWTWRQAANTQTLPETRGVFFNVDGLPPATSAEVRAAMEDIAALVQRFCGGETRCVLLDAEHPQLPEL
ncbi:MAG: phenylalanine--tRNA ligase beta subunit-related protein [Steroidobacteraceae bacterium]